MPRRCPSRKTTTTIVTAKIEDKTKAKNRLRHGGIRDEKKCAFTGSFSNSGFIPSLSRNAYTVIGSLDASPGDGRSATRHRRTLPRPRSALHLRQRQSKLTQNSNRLRV